MTNDPEQDLDDELRFHIEQRTRDYIARGMDPEAARTAAARRFGDADAVRNSCASTLASARAADERRTFIAVSWLDVKLGVRMLAKYRGLSFVAVAGMAVAIAFGAGYFAFIRSFLDASLPLDDGDRVVMIKNRHAPGTGTSGRSADATPEPFDFVQWRDQAATLTDLSAFRDSRRNLMIGDGSVHLVRVAAMTASGFRVARVAPFLGRTVHEEDERPGATPVLVLGYDEWQRHFGGDREVVGRTVRLGGTRHTVVGIMPEGFAFPVRHGGWVALPLTGIETPGAGQSVHVFGRIAGDASLSQARAELDAIGGRLATAYPRSHSGVRPDVVPYTQAFIGIDAPEMQLGLRSLQFGAALLLLIVATNIAILVYARTATRFGEIAVRTALGATRGRVITQLFVEGLVLSSAAAAIGLVLVVTGFAKFREYLRHWPDRPDWWPYWLEPRVSLEVAAYTVLLAVAAAVVTGVIPALKATGSRVQSGLQQFSSRSPVARLGRVWTVLIVVQVALAVAVLPGTINKARGLLRTGTIAPAASTEALLQAAVQLSSAAGVPSESQFADAMAKLLQRLHEDPQVSGATFADAVPGAEGRGMLEADGGAVISSHVNLVAADFFEALDVRVAAGRGFTAADASPTAASVIVDQAFAD